MPESAGGAVQVGKCPSLQGRGSSRSRHACCDLSPWLSVLVLEAVLLTISVRRGEPQNLSSDLVHVLDCEAACFVLLQNGLGTVSAQMPWGRAHGVDGGSWRQWPD